MDSNEALYCNRFRLRLQHQPGEAKPIAIKEPACGPPASPLIAELQHEYAMTACLSDVRGVRQTLGMDGLTLLLDFVPGRTLQQHIETGDLDLGSKLQIAIDLAGILNDVHARHVVHLGITSANILVGENGTIHLIDFGTASIVDDNGFTAREPDAISAQDFAYISPERTGRTKGRVDLRSDFYSLGVVLYELFTAKLPFQADSAPQLIHAHLAKRPTAPNQIDPSIPGVVSAIILKLLAKDADDRYRTAYGLYYDLQLCAEQHLALGKIESFQLGVEDVDLRLQFPATLYGRDVELAQLHEILHRGEADATRLLVISGEAGVGKTALVHEFCTLIADKQGRRVEGKFEQFQRSVPFSAWTQAFTALIDRWLTDDWAQIERRRRALLDAVGASGQALVERIPSLELLIGPQPIAPELEPDAARRRLNYLFSRFISAICSPKQPLTIFLDDLQWIDPASLDLLRSLTHVQSPGLLLIGAYRSNEVDDDHPLSNLLQTLDRSDQFVETLHLEALETEAISALIGDVLDSSPEDSYYLARELHRRSGGNILFTRQLLMTLAAEGDLQLDDQRRRWVWDIERLSALPLADSVIDLLISKLQKLPVYTIEVLSVAACIGTQVDQELLRQIMEKSSSDTWLTLLPAYHAGIIVEQHNRLHFAHDRIQQAAYESIPEDKKAHWHQRIGRKLLAEMADLPTNDRIFDAVDHLNLSEASATNETERLERARLNRDAAEQGMRATAAAAALAYAQRAMDLLGECGWQAEYELQLQLHLLAAEAAYLVADYDLSDRYVNAMLAMAHTSVERAYAYEIRIRVHNVRHQLNRAVETGLAALQDLGVTPIESEPSELSVERLHQLPTMSDPHALAVIQILAACVHPVYVARPELIRAITLTSVDYSLKFGLAPAGCLAIVVYAGLAVWERDIGEAYRLSHAALASLERFSNKSYLCRTRAVFDAYLAPWRTHLVDVHKAVREGIRIGLENGNKNYVGTNLLNDAFLCALTAEDLAYAHQEMMRAIAQVEKVRPEYKPVDAYLWTQYVANLRGNGPDPSADALHFGDPLFDESTDLANAETLNLHNTVFYYHLLKCVLHYHLGNYAGAYDHAQRAAPLTHMIACHFNIHLLTYYQSLTLLQFDGRDGEQLDRLLGQLRLWAEHAPMNYQHKLDLVLAEQTRASGDIAAAIDYYEQAAAGANQNGFLQDEALANELYGRFWQERGNAKVARLYLSEAHTLYRRWGAEAVTTHLEAQYPDWLPANDENAVVPRAGRPSLDNPSSDLDWRSVMDAAEAIAGAQGLTQLVRTMMTIIMTNSGAERVVLLTNHGDEWTIEAQADAGEEDVHVGPRGAVAGQDGMVAASVVGYVARTRQPILLDDALSAGRFVHDPVIQHRRVRSLLALPLSNQGNLSAILYLENNLAPYIFSPQRVQLLELLSGQMAISIEQSRLLDRLEAEILDRTQELSFAEEQVRTLFLRSHVGISLLTVDGRILTVNPALRRMTGYSEDEMVERPVTDFYVELGQWEEVRQRLLASEAVNEEAVNFRRKDGSRFYANVNIGSVVRKRQIVLLAIFEDVTERKRAEEALRSSRRLLQSSLDALSASIAVLDEAGLMIEINDAWRRSAQDGSMAWPDYGLGRSYLAVLDGAASLEVQSARQAADGIRSVMAKDRDFFAMEYAFDTPDALRWFAMRVTRFDQQGAIRVVVAHEDITERKLGEMQRAELAVYAERNRLARELHDSVSQTLYSLDLFANAAQQALAADKSELAIEHAQQIRTLSHYAFAEMRRLLFELRPPELEEMGLVGALRMRLEMVEARAGIETDLQANVVAQLTPALEAELYAIALEALNNSLKHGEAKRVNLALDYDGRHCSLVIQDDGVGFDMDKPTDAGGQGIRNMHERVGQIDGTLTVQAAPGSGVIIKVETTQ